MSAQSLKYSSQSHDLLISLARRSHSVKQAVTLAELWFFLRLDMCWFGSRRSETLPLSPTSSEGGGGGEKDFRVKNSSAVIGADIPEAGAGGWFAEPKHEQPWEDKGYSFSALEPAEPAWWERHERTLSPILSHSVNKHLLKHLCSGHWVR